MEKELDLWITTEDNPFSPFTQYERWLEYDVKCKHMTCDRVAKRAYLSDANLTEYENDRLVMMAMEDVVEHDFDIDSETGKVIKWYFCTPESTKAW